VEQEKEEEEEGRPSPNKKEWLVSRGKVLTRGLGPVVVAGLGLDE
jgi:hypothetical protein